jgi:hypothetical protein
MELITVINNTFSLETTYVKSPKDTFIVSTTNVLQRVLNLDFESIFMKFCSRNFVLLFTYLKGFLFNFVSHRKKLRRKNSPKSRKILALS